MRFERIDKQAKPAPKQPEQEQVSEKTESPHADHQLISLQRMVGNQGTQRMFASYAPAAAGNLPPLGGVIQAKLSVGAPDDQYEQEADQMAEKIVTSSNAPQNTVQEESLQAKRIQRDDLPEEEELQAKRIQRDDMPEEEELQAKRIQRQAAGPGEEEDDLMLKRIQRSAEANMPEVTADIESRIEDSRGQGQALPEVSRGFFEQGFGQDFSAVRVHTGAEADTLNRSLDARAFTTGGDIYFRQGEYNPDTSDGKKLMAHELTHVVQQGSSKPKGEMDAE